MLGINPYISFKGTCREAIEFYKSALGAEVLFLQTMGESPMCDQAPPEQIMHCALKAGGSTIMMSDDPRPDAATDSSNISLAIGLDDAKEARKLFDNLAAGGTVILPLDQTFWAEAFGMVADKFGVKWMINCEKSK